MIRNFKVNNFKGIESEANICSKASNKIKRSKNNCSKISDDIKLLKKICIIGCNGSGKTSFLLALQTLQEFISFPFRKNINFNDTEYTKYVNSMDESQLKSYLMKLNTLTLGEQNVNKPNEKTEIEIELYIPQRENGIPGFYTYTLVYDKSYSQNGVILEKLVYRPKYVKKNIINVCKKEHIMESQIGTTILYANNSLKYNYTKYIEYYKTFVSEMLEYTICCLAGGKIDIKELLTHHKKDFIKLCNIADDKIVNVTVDENNSKTNFLFLNKSNNSLYFSQLSEGTRKIIILGSIIIKALENNSTILIDEIEQNLHPSLISFLLDLITSKGENNYSQVLFTTHSPFLAFTLENDELYFIDNHSDQYFFSNITNAIKKGRITKDQSRQKAWVDNLLIKNPDKNSILDFLNSKKD